VSRGTQVAVWIRVREKVAVKSDNGFERRNPRYLALRGGRDHC
jgi:hypothetical protein